MKKHARDTFERAVKLTQMLFAGQTVTAQLIAERFDVSEAVGFADMNDLEALLPVEISAGHRRGDRGRFPRALRLPRQAGR